MKRLVGSLADYLLSALYGKKQFQSFFGLLHSIALKGMNLRHRPLSHSGETEVLRQAFRYFQSQGIKPVLFDVGANEGQYADEVLRVFASNVVLHCFEPSQTTFQRLSARLADRQPVHLHPFGLGEEYAEVEFFVSSQDSTLSSVVNRQDAGPAIYDGVERVTLHKLDDFCAEHQIPHIHFLKMDVEGHEMAVLKGASRMLAQGAVDMVQFEFSNRNVDSRTYLKDFFTVLAPQYALYRIVRDGLKTLPEYHADYEIFTAGNYLAISKLVQDAVNA